MKMCYIAHPFQGKPENVADAEKIILKLLKLYPDTVFLSPLHATGFYYFALSYELGMEHCFEMLKRCDELWLCENWRTSRGCGLEYDYADRFNMPIKYITSDFEILPLKEGNT